MPPDELIPSPKDELSLGKPASNPITARMAEDLLALSGKKDEVAKPEDDSRSPANLGPTEDSPWIIPELSLEMLWCKPGTFQMGTTEDEGDYWHDYKTLDETLREVTLTTGYWLGKYPVTQAQWERVMGDNPSSFKGADRPVESVSWEEVTSFCEKLTELERRAGRLPAGMAYQLPTEAQWEYACRAGTKTRFSFGDELTAEDANFGANVGETTEVGKYPANAWGFHDMHGNVWEWCDDWLGDYPTGAASDPTGPAGGSDRVLRGGSWLLYDAHSSFRFNFEPAYSGYSLGVRLSLRPANKGTNNGKQQRRHWLRRIWTREGRM